MATAAPLLGIDLGGTKIEVAALDHGGGFLLRERAPTPQGDYAGTLRAIADLVALAEARLGLAGRALPVGIAMPGAISPKTGLVKNANSTVLNGKPLALDLERLLRRPVRLQNDANCLAVSEAVDGAAAGARMVFAVILGTGVGAGIAIDGRAWTGRNAIAGEWGHNPLPWPRELDGADERPGPACWCGQHGCLETWLSGPGFARDHERHGGGTASPVEIVAAMRAGDATAAASFSRYV
ncbi:MAG: ROK family protein, partial [Planctomycetes bacterium]|nr:ROK family protein [Planctomycetota bacterium]